MDFGVLWHIAFLASADVGQHRLGPGWVAVAAALPVDVVAIRDKNFAQVTVKVSVSSTQLGNR